MKRTLRHQMAHAGILASLCAALVGCGGGSGGSAETAAPAAEPATSLAIKRGAPVKVTASAPGYYVDARTGSDSNGGTIDAPWKTLAKLNSVRLAAGEGIWLKCGSVWRESLVLGAEQLVDGSSLAAYGSDCNSANLPRITGSDDVSGAWTRNGNVWSRAVPAMAKVPKVFVNGKALRVAQWPNFGGMGHEYALTAEGAPDSTISIRLSAADRTALAGKDVADAKIAVRTEPWMIESASVATLDAAGIRLRAPTSHVITAGDGYVLQDKLWMLDAPGEFFHDQAAGRLYVIAADDAAQANLNSALVEVVVRETALGVSGRSRLAISKIAVDMSAADGMVLNHAPATTVTAIDASNNIGAGLRINLPSAPALPARGATITGSRFAGNGDAGIDAGNALAVDITSNTITGTGMGQARWANAAVIAGDGATVDSNVITDSAFRGVLFSGFKGTRISNNMLSTYCLRLSDCAAIYTVNQTARQDVQQVASVEGNRVTGGVLNVEGTVNGRILAGIYLDDLSQGVTVKSNVLHGMPIGLFLHNGSNNAFESNRIWLTTDVSVWAVMDHADADLMRSNVFRNNELVPSTTVAGTFPNLPQVSASPAIRFQHELLGAGALGSANNYFSGTRIVVLNGDSGTVADVGTRSTNQRLSAAAWAAINPGEALLAPPAAFALYKPTLGAELVPGNGFDTGLGEWSSYFSPSGTGGNATVVSSANGCVGPCVRMTSGMAGDRLSSPIFRMTAGTQYIVSFTASFSAATEIAHPNIARPETPYDSYVAAPGLRSSNSTLQGHAGESMRYEAFFTASSGDPARINLRVATPGVAVAFDSVSLRPVTGYTMSNFGDWGAVVLAPPASPVTVGCADLGWASNCTAIDVTGAVVAMPVTLPAATSRMLLWSNSAWRL